MILDIMKKKKVDEMNSKKCCGCTACVNICSKSAISMIHDNKGFEIPHINLENCIDCGICAKVCPSLDGNLLLNETQNTYAAYSPIDQDRERSSSGAFFPVLARKILNLGGYICGCILDSNDMTVKHIVTNDIKLVKRMSDSKYVQSSMQGCFQEIKTHLNNNLYVLFTGTSCQVNGLNEFLKKTNCNIDKLITVDLICHGVPSPLIYKEYLKFYEKEKGSKVTDMTFRTKKYGWATGDLVHIPNIRCGNRDDSNSFISRIWQNCFFSDMCLREYCYSCPYTSTNKPSDITIGDFWGIETILPSFNDQKGCSLILIHTVKGKEWFKNMDLISHEVQIEKAIKYQNNLNTPSKKSKVYDNFWNDYHQKGFKYVASKYLNYSKWNSFRYFLKLFFKSIKMNKLSDKVSKNLLH